MRPQRSLAFEPDLHVQLAQRLLVGHPWMRRDLPRVLQFVSQHRDGSRVVQPHVEANPEIPLFSGSRDKLRLADVRIVDEPAFHNVDNDVSLLERIDENGERV